MRNNIIIGAFIILILAIAYSLLFKSSPKPLKDTRVELIGELSEIDRNTTRKTDTLIDSITSGERGVYE